MSTPIAQHTPGPWFARGCTVYGPHHLGQAARIALTSGTARSDTENEANARLIAAAPELLAALREAEEWNANDIRAYDEATPPIEMLKRRRKVLKTAIAKAEGRP